MVSGLTYNKEISDLNSLKRKIEKDELLRYQSNNITKVLTPPSIAASVFAGGVGVVGTVGIAGMASAYFGGGILGGMAACSTAIFLGPTALLIPAIPATIALFYSEWEYEIDAENRTNSQNSRECTSCPVCIEIEPKLTATSVMDDRVLVSKFTWAVTLITGPKGDSKSHAAIIVEGLANAYFKNELVDGEYFMHKLLEV